MFTPLPAMSRQTSTSIDRLLNTVAVSAAATVNAEAASASSYSVVLASAPGKNLKWQAKKSPLFRGRTFYVEQTMIKGSPWERLCLGYFENRKQAASIVKEIQNIYPGAWLQQTSVKNNTL